MLILQLLNTKKQYTASKLHNEAPINIIINYEGLFDFHNTKFKNVAHKLDIIVCYK